MPDLTFESIQRPWIQNSTIQSQQSHAHRNRLVVFGRIRTCHHLAIPEYILFSLALATFAISIHFTTLSFIHGDKRDSVLSLLILVNSVFVFIFATYGIFTEEPFAIIALNFAKAYSSVLLVTNYVVGYEQFTLVEAILSCSLLCLFLPVSFLLVWQYWSKTATVVRDSSPTRTWNQLHRWLSMSRSLLTMDGQLTLNLLVLMLVGRKEMSAWQLAGVTMGAIFFCLWLIFGHLAMGSERTRWIWLFLTVCSAQEVYVAFVVAITPEKLYPDHLNLALRISVIVWQTIHILTIVVLLMMLEQFGNDVLYRSMDLEQSTVFFNSSTGRRLSRENVTRFSTGRRASDPIHRNLLFGGECMP